MKKSIFLFFAAILYATSALGIGAKQCYVYFDNSTWNATNVKFVFWQDKGSNKFYIDTESMTTLSNTQLKYVRTTDHSSWSPAIAAFNFLECANASDWGDQELTWSNFQSWAQTKYTAKQSDWDFNSGYQLFTGAQTEKNKSVSGTYNSGYANLLQKTHTLKVMVSTDGGATYEQATTSPATVTCQTYIMKSATVTSSTKYTIAKDATTTSNSSVKAIYTAKTTLKAENIADGYTFVGWYDATNGTMISTSATPSAWYPKEAITLEARFSKEEAYPVTISYMCGSEEIESPATEIVGVSTASAITAPEIDGYAFASWTLGSGVQSVDATANPISITTKSSGIYTLTANYSELPKETVYFINTPTWTDVKAYAYNSENAGWPGVAATKEAEKIGAYEVYSYTAIQGKHKNVIFNGSGGQTADLTWTSGKYYIHNYGDKTGWYTKEDAEALLVVPVVEETVFFVNNKKWSLVQIHAWKDAANNGWPGTKLTATGEKVEGFDVYSFTATQGSYTNLLFNNKVGEEGVQSNNFVWTADKYYYMGAAADYAGGTKEEVAVLVAPDPLATEVYLAGEMTNWGDGKIEFKKATADANTASVTVNLTAKTYKFKLIIGEGNWRGNTGTMKRGGESVHEGGWSFEEEGGDDKNCQIVADIAGDYTFTWNLTDKKLTVAYPPLPKHQVTATVDPAETGTVTGIGEYEQGSTATLVAAPAANYAFKNWTEGGEEVSTEATYSFKVTKAVELVANFVPEVTHEVTVSYICNSNPIPGHAATTLAVGVTTPSTITAPAITHYTFDGWTLGTGIQTEDDATDNPIHITTKAEGGYTLTANYTKIELTYTVKVPAGTEKCYIAGEMTSWSFQEMTPTANANEFTITIDGATTDHKYKYACGDGWAYVEKKADGSELDADRTYNANDVVAKWAEPAKCYLMGIGGDWTTGIEMEEDGDQFKLLCQPIAEGEQFKFKYGDTWTTDVENYDANGVAWVESYPGSGQYNITLPAGNYDFYYKKNENRVWIGVCTPATPTPDYTRATTAGKFGTICLPFGGTVEGAELFECVGSEPGKVYLGSVTTLVAGVPYIFQATATELAVYSDGTTAVTAGNSKGLYGTFTDETPVAAGNYILLNNKLRPSDGNAKVNANRAYLVMGEVPADAPQQMPGRRYIGMSVQGENEATGLDNIATSENAVKVINNGQLIIIRNGEKFNAQGQKL